MKLKVHEYVIYNFSIARKSIYLCLAFVTSVGYAQPTINQANLTSYLPCEAFVGAADGINLDASGANATWDFTHVELTPAGTNDILPSSATLLSDNFGRATFCMAYTNNACEAFAYYRANAQKIEWVGDAFTCLDEINRIANPKTYVTFPYTYNTIIRDDFTAGSGCAVSFTSTYDAYGTLMMPYGTHYNVVRQKIVCNGQTDYIWFNTEPFYPIVQTSTADKTMGITMYSDPRADFEPDQNFTVSFVSDGILAISTAQAQPAALKVFDLSGRLMASKQMDATACTVNLQHCDAGIYFVSMKTDSRYCLKKIEKCSSALPNSFSGGVNPNADLAQSRR